MAYGVFKGDEHIYTYEKKHIADKFVSKLDSEFYVRELTFDEYHKRMKEIYVDKKYNKGDDFI